MEQVKENELVVDVKGQLCPMPIIRLSQNINKIGVGDTLRLVATDPGSQNDIPAWARQTGHKLVNTETNGNEFTYVVKRTH